MRLCECGCGRPTPIAPRTSAKRQTVKGEPTRFAGPGHFARVSAEPLEAKYIVDPATGCWEWQRAKTRGYGVVQDLRTHRQVMAHRLVYELARGVTIPDELTLDHLCRNHGCVNPDHLEPVTRGENVLRGIGIPAVNARKTHCMRGHEFTPENTYVQPSTGSRRCETCFKMLQQKYAQQRRLLSTRRQGASRSG